MNVASMSSSYAKLTGMISKVLASDSCRLVSAVLQKLTCERYRDSNFDGSAPDIVAVPLEYDDSSIDNTCKELSSSMLALSPIFI